MVAARVDFMRDENDNEFKYEKKTVEIAEHGNSQTRMINHNVLSFLFPEVDQFFAWKKRALSFSPIILFHGKSSAIIPTAQPIVEFSTF